MTKPFLLEFEIKGLPKMSNSLLRGHWRVKHAHAKAWKRKVWKAVWPLIPAEPLEKAKLTLIRCSSSEPDTDGLISGFKHIVDGLVEANVLSDDKPSNIGIPDYKWQKTGHGKGKIIVKVEGVA